VLAAERERALSRQQVAYYGGYWAGVFSQSYGKNKYPKFEKYFPRGKSAKEKQSWQQMKSLAMAYTATHGGEFKKR